MIMTMAMDDVGAITSHGVRENDETKCLLTPTSAKSCMFLENDCILSNGKYIYNSVDHKNFEPPLVLNSYTDSTTNNINQENLQQIYLNPPLIYSEPALLNLKNTAVYNNWLSNAYSEAALANIYIDQLSLPFFEVTHPDTVVSDELEDIASEDDEEKTFDQNANKIKTALNSNQSPRKKVISKVLLKNFTPKSSCFFTESQPSVVTNVGSINLPHKQSFSTREIREQHMQIQKKYRPSRKRHYTDPVDFEGILNIIGGCSWWQIWVYLLISLQQIPHAMFNLSVVYMMYQPDHWCQVAGMNETLSNNKTNIWTNRNTFHTSIVYPKTKNKQRDILDFHSQCHYYSRGIERYKELRRMSLEDAQKAVNSENRSAPIVKCQQWEYDQDVMKHTIVTEWNLVCDDNFKRAHAHLFYSFGFLFGCLLGGFASDRFGRKPTVIGFGILSSMFGLILPYSTYFSMFLFIRFCGAVCNEAADLAAYVLCMELTGTQYRAMVGSLLQAPWAVGYATLALIAYFCKSWQYIQLITAGLHTITICLICVLPESPRWLIVNNRVEEAERYIRRACREPPFPFNLFKFNKCSLPCDLELVKHAEQRKWVRRGQKANILHLLKSRALCVRTAIMCVVWIATALVYYGLIIALSDQSAPGRVFFSGNFFVNNAIAGAIELPTLLACVYLMKHGRKRSQMITLMGAAIFIFAAMAAINNKNPMLALFLMLMGKIFIQGAFNILYIFTSEIYPTVIRNSAVGFSSMIARFGSGVSSYIAILSDVTLAIVPMIIFATFSFFAGLLVMLLPETRDQPLPDTLQDAVTFLKNDHRYECYGFGGGNNNKNNISKYENKEKREKSLSKDKTKASFHNEIVEEKIVENNASSALTNETDSTNIGNLSRKRSDTFNETLPAIPEAPHDVEIQGTWSAALTVNQHSASKISAAALFEEMAATNFSVEECNLKSNTKNYENEDQSNLNNSKVVDYLNILDSDNLLSDNDLKNKAKE